MIEYDVSRATKAVQLLVNVNHFNDYVKTLNRHVARPRAFPYKGDNECLNELLVIGRQNKKALDNLIEVARFKRDNNDRKAQYQRDFMARKYARDKKAIQLEEKFQGRRLKLEERRQLLLKQYDVWNKEKTEYIAMHGEMSWKEKNTVISDFWKLKEQELDQLLQEADKAQVKHELNKKKRVVVVNPPKETAMKSALKKALDRRK